jgi:hypothetical protein
MLDRIFVQFEPAFIATAQAAELMQPGQRPFDDPALARPLRATPRRGAQRAFLDSPIK